jgi:hypothetical protein
MPGWTAFPLKASAYAASLEDRRARRMSSIITDRRLALRTVGLALRSFSRR